MLDMRINGLAGTSSLRWLALALGFTLAGPALAQTGGTGGIVVTETSGVLRYRIGDSSLLTAAKGQVIPAGARIVTGAGSSAVLTFPDGMLVALGEQSRLRVLEFRFLPGDIDKSRAVINLTDGSVRIALGAIGQREPSLIQLQVGEGGLARALERPRAGDISLSVHGIAVLVQVGQGRVSLNVADRSIALASGQSALVRQDGFVQVSGAAQLADAARQSEDGRLMQGRFDKMLGTAFAPGSRSIVITLSTPPGRDFSDEVLLSAPGTAATGAAAGGSNAGGSVSPN
jgi:hypothetical protein